MCMSATTKAGMWYPQGSQSEHPGDIWHVVEPQAGTSCCWWWVWPTCHTMQHFWVDVIFGPPSKPWKSIWPACILGWTRHYDCCEGMFNHPGTDQPVNMVAGGESGQIGTIFFSTTDPHHVDTWNPTPTSALVPRLQLNHAKCFSFYFLKIMCVLSYPRHMGYWGGWSLKPEMGYGNALGPWVLCESCHTALQCEVIMNYVCTETLDAMVEGQGHQAHSLPNQAACSHSEQGDGKTFHFKDHPKIFSATWRHGIYACLGLCHSSTFIMLIKSIPEVWRKRHG